MKYKFINGILDGQEIETEHKINSILIDQGAGHFFLYESLGAYPEILETNGNRKNVFEHCDTICAVIEDHPLRGEVLPPSIRMGQK